MSRSPRKSLRRADQALADLFAVLEQYPEARRKMVDAVGEATLATISAGHQAIAAAAQVLEQEGDDIGAG